MVYSNDKIAAINQEFIARAITASGKTQQELADHLGVSKQAITKWKSTGKISTNNILRSAEFLGSALPCWLTEHMGHGGEPAEVATPITAWESPADLDPQQYTTITRFDASASAGNGKVIYSAPEKEKPQSFRIDWLHENGWKEKDLFCLTAEGDSMWPSIADGANLLINKKDTDVVDGKVYLLRIGGNVQVKRLYWAVDGGLRVVSDNKNYPEKEVSKDQLEFVKILGRVVWQAGIL